MRGRDARGGHGGSGRRPGVPLVMSDGRWGHSEIMESGPHAVVEGPVVFAVVVGAERVDLGEVRVEVVVVEALVRGRRAAAGQLDVLQQRHHVVPQRLVVLSQLRASLTSTSRLLRGEGGASGKSLIERVSRKEFARRKKKEQKERKHLWSTVDFLFK